MHCDRNSWFVAQSVSSNARRAAPMASSTSSVVASAVTPMTASVAGLMFSYVRPPVAATSLPSISMRDSSIVMRFPRSNLTSASR